MQSLAINPKSRFEGMFDFNLLLPELWLLLACALTYAVVNTLYREAETQFNVRSTALRMHFNDRLLSNEAVLEGFSTLLGVEDEIDASKAKRYSDLMRAHYPHIFMLEIARKVSRSGLPALERAMTSAGHANFKVRNFSYLDGREWIEPVVKAYYYPIVFMNPLTPESEQVLGLDIDSVPFLRNPLATSLSEGHYIASQPFKLVEGDRAYVMHRKVDGSGKLIALLVVKADGLLGDPEAASTLGLPELGFALRYRGLAQTGPHSLIVHRDEPLATKLETWLLPTLHNQGELGGKGQPFDLDIRHQLRWNDFNLPALIGITLINLAVFAMLLRHALFRRRDSAEKQIQTRRWAYLANHDPLTDLPNRFLLMDRLEMALHRAQRNKTRFALIFMDVDRFKQVNDTYGHQAGDLVLKMVANGIQSAIRAEDAIARIGGDEFVVVLEDVAQREQAEEVGRKILTSLPELPEPDYPGLRINLSLGIAMYPEDGSDADSLIKTADEHMYRNKRRQLIAQI